MKHESLTCKIREKSPRKFKTLTQCHSTRKWQRREQIPAFSIAHSVWCSFSTPTTSLHGPFLNTSGSISWNFTEPYGEGVFSSMVWPDLAGEGKRQEAWVKGTDPFPQWSSEIAQLPANWSHTVTYFRPWGCPMTQTSGRLLFLHLWLVRGHHWL